MFVELFKYNYLSMKRFVFNVVALAVLFISAACSSSDEPDAPKAVPADGITFSASLSSNGEWFENGDILEATLNISNLKTLPGVVVNSFKMLIDGNVVQEVPFDNGMNFTYKLSGLSHGEHKVSFAANVSGDDYLETDLEKLNFDVCIFNEKPVIKCEATMMADIEVSASNGETYKHYLELPQTGYELRFPANFSWQASNGEMPPINVIARMKIELAEETVGNFEITANKYYWNIIDSNPVSEYMFDAGNPLWFDPFYVYPKITVEGEHEGIPLSKTFYTSYKVICDQDAMPK